ncbi:MAG: hypothetical protein L6V80_00915 [Bacteroidales bacterium]|nr:MAG: hypothetical protein L6V80_00915 [Bacteroidales bacterium]
MHYFDTIIEHYGWQGTALAVSIMILFFVQLYYHIVLYGRIVRFRNSRRKKILEAEPSVSIIVPLFSEDYDYLDERLPALFAQEYSAPFEVVVVYVGADGDFYEELTRQRLNYPNLTVTKIEYNPRFPISVKMAINVGIKSASYNHLLLTTASATPASTQWLAMMGKAFMRGQIVIGYTAIESAKGLGNYLMRLSRLQMSVYWLTQAVSRNTYRGIRHNIGFTKELYFANKGFTHLNMNIGEGRPLHTEGRPPQQCQRRAHSQGQHHRAPVGRAALVVRAAAILRLGIRVLPAPRPHGHRVGPRQPDAVPAGGSRGNHIHARGVQGRGRTARTAALRRRAIPHTVDSQTRGRAGRSAAVLYLRSLQPAHDDGPAAVARA